MNWYSNGGRSGLVRALMAKGLSVRKAEKAVNAVFSCMRRGLQRGEVVEIPGGKIYVKEQAGKRRGNFHKFANIHTGDFMYKLVTYRGKRRVVKFIPDEELDLTPLPKPKPKPTPEQIECRQLVSELLGRPADDSVMAELQQALDLRPHREGALLRRLRECKRRERRYTHTFQLAGDIFTFFWL